MMSGSCFVENCPTRAGSYTLSAGVTFRGTRGSSCILLQVKRSVQVAVTGEATHVADKHPRTQWQFVIEALK